MHVFLILLRPSVSLHPRCSRSRAGTWKSLQELRQVQEPLPQPPFWWCRQSIAESTESYMPNTLVDAIICSYVSAQQLQRHPGSPPRGCCRVWFKYGQQSEKPAFQVLFRSINSPWPSSNPAHSSVSGSLHRGLQSSSVTVSGMMEVADVTRSVLSSLRNDDRFGEIFLSAQSRINDFELMPLSLPRRHWCTTTYQWHLTCSSLLLV